jgi:hypothetical protein
MIVHDQLGRGDCIGEVSSAGEVLARREDFCRVRLPATFNSVFPLFSSRRHRRCRSAEP